jgi:hypothetical protein
MSKDNLNPPSEQAGEATHMTDADNDVNPDEDNLMARCFTFGDTNQAQPLQAHILGHWIEQEWLPTQATQNGQNGQTGQNEVERITLLTREECAHEIALKKFDHDLTLTDDYQFAGYTPTPCPAIPRIDQNRDDEISYRTGAFVIKFVQAKTNDTVEVLVVASLYRDVGDMICLACLPRDFLPVWNEFAQECVRLAHAREPEPRVIIIGGRTGSFVPTVDWDDIVLPEDLKEDLIRDVRSFYDKGIEIYKKLKLKPFRKLLLTGVPGTGKTMICSALAKWAIAREYPVIYISSADRDRSTFNKIEHALSIAASSRLPAMIILEELDAYLHDEEKAIVLNVLDGAESAINDWGTLLVTTTNYPESIDERIMKRPGRLDRIFVIPQTKKPDDAEKILRQYLGDMWRDEHQAIVQHLVGYPGAFVREVAVYALTQVAYNDELELPLEVLQQSYDRLKTQIQARDDFLMERSTVGFHSN